MTRQLYLLRHADAGDPHAWAGDDDDRPLSGKGFAEARRLGRHLASIGFRPDVVMTSPKERARKTAEEVAAALGVEVQVDDRLGSSVSVGVLERLLADAPRARRVVLVGHDPDFSELVGQLTGAADIPMKKGALARIDLEGPVARGGGVLRWLIPPDLVPGEE